MKNFLIKLLFRLIDGPYWERVDEDSINKWLLAQYGDSGFRNYIKHREMKLFKNLSLGIGGEKEYNILIGQILENREFLQDVKTQYQIKLQQDKAAKELVEREKIQSGKFGEKINN